MKVLYVLAGIPCLGFGIYTFIKHQRKFNQGTQNKYGFDVQGLFTGIMFIIIGLGLIIQNI
jgi:hypothetical protein